jgi:hypothetical protein
VNECTEFVPFLEWVCTSSGHGRPRKRPKRLAGDKAYSTQAIRAWCRSHNVRAVIPERHDPTEPRRRRLGRKPVFRIATRSEKLAVHSEAMIDVTPFSVPAVMGVRDGKWDSPRS